MQSISSAQSSSSLLSGIYFPYDISFIDCDSSPALRFQIEEQLIRVSHFYDRITDCKVSVRVLHKHSGIRFFHINVHLDVPGRRLAVSREPEARSEHSDPRVAVRHAFNKVTRQLEDYVKSRNDKKSRPRLMDFAPAELE